MREHNSLLCLTTFEAMPNVAKDWNERVKALAIVLYKMMMNAPLLHVLHDDLFLLGEMG